ncbi:MAG: FAD binding domain-containing protein [Candidatus Tectomicrobia bacterium]|uniref:FAD binding domain-containing protein n=1 Tax=Tectimicrobiota bacterium TaxID=2528274 RepID=A0A932M129_UNCTE|nr:FAD binding domain-containing protein [Candidatus Tectomicrobia bacterium]
MNYLRELPKFEYLAPQSIPEVCEMLAAHEGEAKLMAGGTDLIIMMRRREVVPHYLIGLKSVPELNFIREEKDGGLTIGAMATSWEIQSSSLVRQRYDFLAKTAADIGSIENLHVSTIGGNLCDGFPCVDFPAPLLTLDAKVKLVSQRGERIVPLDGFYLGYQKTAVEPDELLTEIQILPHNHRYGGAYIKFHDRHAIDITTTGAGAFITLDSDGQTARDVKIALTTSAPVPLRVKGAEAALCGRKVTEEATEEAGRIASEEASPRTSWRSTAEFRTKLVQVLVRRALRQAWRKVTTSSSSGAAPDLWLMHPLDPRIGENR